MKLTPWFPASVKPVRVGVYRVESGGWYAYWNGRKFGWRDLTPSKAYANRNEATLCTKLASWCGLAEKPE